MGLKLNTASSGSVSLEPANTASNYTLTVPAQTGTVVATDSSGNVGIGTSSPATKLDVNGSVRLPDGYEVGFGSANSTYWLGDSTNNWHRFYTNNSERMRIDSSGNLIINNTAQFGSGRVSVRYVPGVSTGVSFLPTTDSSGPTPLIFLNATGSAVGSVTTTGSGTAYNTSSDYRLKENIAPMTGALDKVSALKPCTYTWKSTGEESQGFIAHELAEVVPECVTGEKDAVDAEGNPVYQGIDTSFLVATLTAAIQEQQAIINDLKARIETLEAK